jgi:Dolichyl-phosphate-mannose-protein mannosyltransferase
VSPIAAGSTAAETRAARLWLAAIVVLSAAFRFYNLGWGAPYYHFHIDEHFVFTGADTLVRDPAEAAQSPKFFMYSPLPMYALIVVRKAYEALFGPLVLTARNDEVVFMVIGRAISAAVGTATIPLVYLIASRVATRRAGLLAAALAACGVLHLRESHFFTVDIPMTFFAVLTLLAIVRLLDRDRVTFRGDVTIGVAFGAAILCKYTAIFLAPAIGVGYLLAGPPGSDVRQRIARGLRAAVPGAIGLAVFLACNPLVVLYYQKFRQDIRDWVTAPLTGEWKPIWAAQFFDVNPATYWFTNVLWWGLGPAFEVAGLAGVAWLLWRRDRRALVCAAVVLGYFLVAGGTVTPFARYGVPLVPLLAIAAGVFLSDLLDRVRGAGSRWIVRVAVGLVILATAAYAAAYMRVFIAPDVRLTASSYVQHRAPAGSRVLVEPSQNMVPFGKYLNEPSFYQDYMLRNPAEIRDDYYHLVVLDTYVYLYDPRHSDVDKRAYIASRLAQADYIVMDDTFVQFYQHLPAADHAAVKQYYADLFAGRLGFELMRTFKVYPSLFGVTINDDAAELSFRLFDHPRIFVFRRTAAAGA